MKLKNGQKVSYEVNGKKYSGTIKETNNECMPYEIEFVEEHPIICGLIIESLLIHRSNLKKIIGTNTFKNE